MPRRTAKKAVIAAFSQNLATVRFLVRNDAFRKDLLRLRGQQQEDWLGRYTAFLKKWKLNSFPMILAAPNGKILITAKEYDDFICNALMQSWHSLERSSVCSPPIRVSRQYEEYVEAFDEGEKAFRSRHQFLGLVRCWS